MFCCGLGDINTVAQTIQKVEGYYPGSLSYRLNNPGNLTYAGQAGATPVQVCNPTCHNFASFPTYDQGYQALQNQIQLDASRGLTIAQFTAKYAPAADQNDPASYASTIANASGLSVSDPLSAALLDSSASGAEPLTDTATSDLSGLSVLSSIPTPVILIGGLAAGLLLFAAVR